MLHTQGVTHSRGQAFAWRKRGRSRFSSRLPVCRSRQSRCSCESPRLTKIWRRPPTASARLTRTIIAPILVVRIFFDGRGETATFAPRCPDDRFHRPAEILFLLARSAHEISNRNTALRPSMRESRYGPAYGFAGIGGTRSAGSRRWSNQLMRQSRCGPVTRPVAPTLPMASPWRSRAPTSTQTSARCE